MDFLARLEGNRAVVDVCRNAFREGTFPGSRMEQRKKERKKA